MLAKLFTVATLTLAATSAVHAAECSDSEFEQVASAAQLVYENSACATITTDLTTATQEEVCESSCMDYLATIVNEFPDCEYSGTNLYQSLSAILEMCGTDASSAPASTLGYVSGASVAVAVAAMAVAA